MSAVSNVQYNYKIELSIPHILTLKTSYVIAHSFVCVFSVTVLAQITIFADACTQRYMCLQLIVVGTTVAEPVLDGEMAKFIITKVGDKFCELVEQEKEAKSLSGTDRECPLFFLSIVFFLLFLMVNIGIN